MATPQTYSEKLRDPRWQKKRLQIMERDGFKCRDCGAKDKTLNVHHCHYFKGGPWDTPDSLLRTLCEDCHAARGDIESDIKTELGVIFSRSRREDIAALLKFLSLVAEARGFEIKVTPEEAVLRAVLT